MATTWSRATSMCNSAPWHCSRLISVSRYLFLTMLSWLEQVSEPTDVHKHQRQCQQEDQGPLQGVTHLPGIIEGWFWCPDICFWLCWLHWKRFQNVLDVHQHHQWQQQGPGPLQGVTQLPDIIECWSWCLAICFWPCLVDWNIFHKCLMYTNTNYSANNRVQAHFKM